MAALPASREVCLPMVAFGHQWYAWKKGQDPEMVSIVNQHEGESQNVEREQ